MDNTETYPSVDELIGHFVTLSQEDTERSFEKGEIIAVLLKMGMNYKSIASKASCSSEYVRVLYKTFEAFPKEDDRHFHEQSFYHYRLAASQDEPKKWMKKAMMNEWSTREMAAAMKDNPIPDEYREAERLLFQIRKVLGREDISDWFMDKLKTIVEQHQRVLATDKKDVSI